MPKYLLPSRQCCIDAKCPKPRRPGFTTCHEHFDKEDKVIAHYQRKDPEGTEKLLTYLVTEMFA